MAASQKPIRRQVTVWVHDDNFSKDEVLVASDILGEDRLLPNALMEIIALKQPSDFLDSQDNARIDPDSFGDTAMHSASKIPRARAGQHLQPEHQSNLSQTTAQNARLASDPRTRYVFIAKPMPLDIRSKHPTFQVSITTSIASRFGYRQRAQAAISLANKRSCSASHVELVFRDEYLSRSDMWRLVRAELAGKTVYRGQKIQFLATIKAVVKTIHVRGRKVSSGYFGEATVPVFRSESARYVLFIQMSREMWDFDSEGTGEIMFSRVIDGFLPELFKKWVELEARHLVSIVLFGRLEYDRHAPAVLQRLNPQHSDGPSIDIDEKASYRDFYRVVVTDMASGQWTTILNELKKDFRTYLRDISLLQPQEEKSSERLTVSEAETDSRTRICGRPTSALRGNILEAINIASSQFASDYIDRDLVRTGISIIVITPGTGVFEVDRQLLDLTSENLTNNGIGIDLVCLSKMPLHSVPLFKWRTSQSTLNTMRADSDLPLHSSLTHSTAESKSTNKGFSSSQSDGSLSQSTPRGEAVSVVPEAQWSFGIPRWIDVSYWASTGQQRRGNRRKEGRDYAQFYLNPISPKPFVPRVRMYELQMMGLMELGLANISVPYLSEGRHTDGYTYKSPNGIREHTRPRSTQFEHLASSPRSISSPRISTSAYSGRLSRGLLSVQAKQQGDMYERMDAYDQNLFRVEPSNNSIKIKLKRKNNNRYKSSSDQGFHGQFSSPSKRCGGNFDTSDTDTIRSSKGAKTAKSQASGLHSKGFHRSVNPTDLRISRSISFALRGLGPSPPRAVASTEINVENIRAEHPGLNVTQHHVLGDSSKTLRTPGNHRSNRLSVRSIETASSGPSDADRPEQSPKRSPSRPILINNPTRKDRNSDQRSGNEVTATSMLKVGFKGAHTHKIPLQPKNTKETTRTSKMSDTESEEDVTSIASIPDIPPWVRNVNPANPIKFHSMAESWVGRWQHLYPRTPRTSSVKWKSLCSPASLPLTTKEFPSMKELDRQYTQTGYIVSHNDDSDLAEVPESREWLLREMIGLRLSHGYQIVIGEALAEATGIDAPMLGDYLTPEKLAEDGVPVFMSMGNTIQKLVCVDNDKVQVTRFLRKQPEATLERTQCITYRPWIRTILSKSYYPRTMTFAGFSEEYPWKLADSHMAGQKDDLGKIYEQLRFWRARFVVIPTEPPPSAKWPIQSMSEDNEEEIHLLGIRELTRLWQKIRYNPPKERHFKPTPGKGKDPNPLEIIFQTLNPSEVVATEIEKLLVTDDGAESRQVQLLPDSELLERSTSSVSRIAQVLQGEKGVDITNRRWHLKLHYSCFKGDDFTNWLISNFKDIDSREEAVAFGNELMRHGLFHHVSTRHTFKDGNYFYTIAPEHRASRPESRSSWFASGRRSDRSVPATPITDSDSHASPLSISQPGWNSARQVDSGASEKMNSEKRQVSVSLTKMMRIGVDSRNPKRSERPEIVNLHYDRLHNPENCYHLELSWFNVTSKFIEDAIVNWATQTEKYGLRLVEVPIAEACSIANHEPFRAPYRIVLKVQPPPSGNVMVGNGTVYSTNSLFANAPSVDRLIYQKALLKKFNFVLDLEAASEFPPDVNVTYTWGKLGYRYPQFVHRSGVVLAQITDEGELYLLANRLYNTRSASAKDVAGKFETKNSQHWPKPASGIVALNPQNPSPHPSPLVRASSDVPGSRDALNASGMAAFITPEQIKDDLEEFCHDTEKLIAFYKETSERGLPVTRKSGSRSSSSLLGPVAEHGLENSIPDLRLPASLVTTATTPAKSLGIGLNKKTSPQPGRRGSIAPDIAATDSSHRPSTDSQ
ncbi:hypothetical protein GJ744_011277 [Endocarpon pusillum]|uniref:Vacuolar membrane-associated protein IML1 n=1 Tax=Endocarpon pusillum TaxID=364733 RepID=A0A8H7EAR7_9EURO|nr:hypothetical protein GJ744_011277 [Endocarpon pusillum]